MKKLFFVSAFLLFLLLYSYVYSAHADVEKLSGPEYFPAVDKALNTAKKSIFLVMYYIDFRKNEPDSKVCILVDDLVKAKEKGIVVKVILDQTVVLFY